MTDICFRCGKEIVSVAGSGATGYGVDRENNKICYQCCGEIDGEELASLKPGEKMILYLSSCGEEGMWYICNWPGSFKIRVFPDKGKHNLAGCRYDVRFKYKEHEYHGIKYGDNTDICHVRRLKK